MVLPEAPTRPAQIVGVDLGLSNAAVIHDGHKTRVVEPQRALSKNLTRLRRLDCRLARKQWGSSNREKARLRRARLYYRIYCQRQDMSHQLSSELARTKRVIVLEDLHVRGMRRNKHLALSISDAGMGELRRQLAYKSEWYGSTLVIADRFFPSSKLCSGCGTIKTTLAMNERQYDCDVCGLSLDRDENAARNLRRLGLAELPVDRREVTPVERKALAVVSTAVKPASMKQEATADSTRCSTRRSTPKDVLVRI
jgi:putative transposase